MQSDNRFAFKEWAVICAALSAGRQSLILRKGGLHEGREGFRVEHPEFWLFPTNFHQTAEELTPNYHDLWEQQRQAAPAEDQISIRFYAVVERVVEITDEAMLPRLTDLHGWSARVVQDRFHYKRPGMFALLVRCYAMPEAVCLPNSPHFAGCRSWVDLPEPLSTAKLRPVLSETEHCEQIRQVSRSLGNSYSPQS